VSFKNEISNIIRTSIKAKIAIKVVATVKVRPLLIEKVIALHSKKIEPL